MEKELPAKINESFFKRFMNYIKRFFGKKYEIEEIKKEPEKQIKKEYVVPTTIKQYKFNENVSKYMEIERKLEKMKEIINIIEKNPYILEKLDCSKLEIIDLYYKKEIMEINGKIRNAQKRLVT